MKFSIIVVCLNPGSKLNQTLDSILAQTCTDYEIVVKDGGSRDGSVEGMRQDERIHLYVEKDAGIYDAMNQAVAHAEGDFILFLNCGDVFYRETVLEETAGFIDRISPQAPKPSIGGVAHEADGSEALGDAAPKTGSRTQPGGMELGSAAYKAGNGELSGYSGMGDAARKTGNGKTDNLVLYGDTYSEKNDVIIAAAPEITGFTCYRNIPCHQSCFYAARLCKEKPYDVSYRIRADYDHFLWCYYAAKAKMQHMGLIVASYEGGGYSESRENRKRDKVEHGQITSRYMSRGELFRYRMIMLATLAPLRKAMAESKAFAGCYHALKEKIYRK